MCIKSSYFVKRGLNVFIIKQFPLFASAERGKRRG